MKNSLLLCVLALVACGGGPGLTPMEQDGLRIVDVPVDAPILFTMESRGTAPELLIPIFEEYARTPLILHVVWRTADAPRTEDLAQFSGKKIRQYWDAKAKTRSTNGQVSINHSLVAIERLSLRMGLARAAAFPIPN